LDKIKVKVFLSVSLKVVDKVTIQVNVKKQITFKRFVFS
jgi:hypothetical protein